MPSVIKQSKPIKSTNAAARIQPVTSPPELAIQGAQPATPSVEPSVAEAAFQSCVPRMNCIVRELVSTINVDIQTAAVFAMGVCTFVCVPDVRARFARLGATGEYNDACVDELGPAAQATWYARHRYLLAMATRSEAQLPPKMVESASALRARMLKLADYWLLDDAAVAAELNAIRVGTGYQDLANDLIALAAVCDRYDTMLSQDRKLYQAGDRALAKQQAADILQRLGEAATSEQNEWSLAQARAWTLLDQTYAKVRRGGLFLFANDGAEERFPSLVTVARATAVRPTKTKTAVETPASPVAAPAEAPEKDSFPPA